MRQNAFVGNAGLVVDKNAIADAYIPHLHALWLPLRNRNMIAV